MQAKEKEEILALLEKCQAAIGEGDPKKARQAHLEACVRTIDAEGTEVDLALMIAEGACLASEISVLGTAEDKKMLEETLADFKKTQGIVSDPRAEEAETWLSKGEAEIEDGLIGEAKKSVLKAVRLMEATGETAGARWNRAETATARILALQAVWKNLKKDKARTLAYVESLKKVAGQGKGSQ